MYEIYDVNSDDFSTGETDNSLQCYIWAHAFLVSYKMAWAQAHANKSGGTHENTSLQKPVKQYQV